MSTFRTPSGAVLREPQAASDFRVGTPLRAGAIDSGIVLLLATSEGGDTYQDGTVYEFRNIQEATQVMRSGNAVRLAELAFSPSNQHKGANVVKYIRAQTATRGTLVRNGGDAQPALTFTSIDRGAYTARIRVTVTNDALIGVNHRAITIHMDTDNDTVQDPGELVETFAMTVATNVGLAALISNLNTGSSLVTVAVGAGTLVAAAVAAPLVAAPDGVLEAPPTNSLALAQTAEKKLLICESAVSTDHSALLTHAISTSEFRCMVVVGEVTGTTFALAQTAAANLGSGQSVYCWPGVRLYTVDGSGNTEVVSGPYFAAMVAGLIAGMRPGRPITRKQMRMLGVEATVVHPLSETERAQALDAGILTVIPRKNRGLVVLQGITTLQANDVIWDPATNSSSEISLTHAVNVLLDGLDVALDDFFVGEDKGQYGPGVVQGFVRDYLQQAVDDLLILDFTDPVVTQPTGDSYQVEFNFNGNNPINFIFTRATVVA